MSILRRYNYTGNPELDELLRVLEPGVEELKADIDRFVDLSNPYGTPEQYIQMLLQTLGFTRGTGLTAGDQRAILVALGWAYHFKGSIHGLRLIARTLWRYFDIVEVYRDILDHAIDEGVSELSDWPDFMTTEDYEVVELLRILINIRLDVYDARRYGELQAGEFRQLLDIVRADSGYDRLLRTYRPGFDYRMSTTLGASQFGPPPGDDDGDDGDDGEGEDELYEEESFLLYGREAAFMDPETQSILESLRWNPYPGLKLAVARRVMTEFIPAVTNLEINILGYTCEDTVGAGADDTLTVYETPSP